MSEPGKKTIVKDEATEIPPIKLEEEPSGSIPATTKQQVEDYLRRKAEVTQDDHQAFQDYLNDKARSVPAPVEQPPAKSKFNRRNLLKVVAGTAVAGEAARSGIRGLRRHPTRAHNARTANMPERSANTSSGN